MEVRLPLVRRGNYTCSAVNLAGRDDVVVDTDRAPRSYVGSSGRRKQRPQQQIQILSTVPGFLLAAGLISLLGYLVKNEHSFQTSIPNGDFPDVSRKSI